MNMLATEAELAVRDSRWGEGIGGIATQDQDFVQLNASAYFSSMKKLAEQQEELGRKMVRNMSMKMRLSLD